MRYLLPVLMISALMDGPNTRLMYDSSNRKSLKSFSLVPLRLDDSAPEGDRYIQIGNV